MWSDYTKTETNNFLIIEWEAEKNNTILYVYINEDANRDEVEEQLRKYKIYIRSCYYPIYIKDGYMYIGTADDGNIWFYRNNKRPLREGLKDIRHNVNSILGDMGHSKEELWNCAKKISKCCQYYRDNVKTNYCHGCPFYQTDSYYTGCILRDSWRNEVDNPGDWDLD